MAMLRRAETLALARWNGRRESAICELRALDVFQDEKAIRYALARAGMDERIAKHVPHGVIRWSEASDKQGFLFILPISNERSWITTSDRIIE